MKGSVIINGTDIANFGVLILKGGDYDFLTFPERKEPTQNIWFEYDGLDVDLSEVFFKDRSLSVQFYISNKNSLEYEFSLNSFYGLISDGYIDMYTREFNKTFRLRYLSVSDYKHQGGFYKQANRQGWFKVNFSMDNPIQLFTHPAIRVPASSKNYPLSGVVLNEYDLSKFGIVVNECYSSMLAQAAVKAPLTRSFAKYTGLVAHPSKTPTFEAKEIIVKCTMAANSLAEFYHNYEALFNHVSQTGELSLNTYLGSAQCYYSKMENFKKHGVFASGVMVSFTLRFIQLNTGLTTYVLGTEDKTKALTPEKMEALIPIGVGYKPDTAVIDTFVSKISAKGGNAQVAKAKYDSLNLLIKTSASKILFPTVVEAGKVYGMDNNTGDLVTFPFARASSATLFDSNKSLQLVSANMPRIDYFNYGTNPKLLIEKVSTNLLIDSTFNLGLNTIQSTTNILNSVNWLNLIDKSVTIPPTGALPNTYFYKGYNVPAIANYSASAIVSSSAVPRFGNSTSEFDGRMVIVSASTTEAQTKIEHIKDTFYRISGSKEPVSAGTSKTTGFVKYSGNNSNDIKASAYQLELGTDSTSYIPTGSTAVTRAADLLTYILPTACSVYIKTSKQNIVLDKPAGTWNIHNDLNNEGIEVIAIFDKILTNGQKQQLTS